MTFATAVLIAAGTYLGAVIGWQIGGEIRRQWLLRKPMRRSAISSLPIPDEWPHPPTDEWLRANGYRVTGTNPYPAGNGYQPKQKQGPIAPPPTEP